jgi:hypothetical protein
MFKETRTIYFLIPFLFLLIYFQVFFFNYAYLDEVYQLWHNNDTTNFDIIHTQGRWLSALLFQKIYPSISTIDQIKIIRLCSLIGWTGVAIACSFYLRKWTRLLDFAEQTWWLSSIYVVCSISVCIYIGFASCSEVSLAVFFGLLSGDISFSALYQQRGRIHLSNFKIISSFFFASVSLFIYQPSFGIFLLPFFLCYVQGRRAKPNRIVVIGIIFYFVAYVIYYVLFKYSLKAYHLEASARAQIHFDFLKKLSFFFSGPFPQGFSMNLLFSASSIFSQIFYPMVFIIWVVTTLKRNRNNKFIANLIFIGFILFLLALIYFPSMIAAENFPSYRTLFVFNLAVFIMVVDNLLYLIKGEGAKKIFTIIASMWLILTGAYAFNFQFINPLKKEYSILRNFFETKYKSNTASVYFIRSDKFLFTRQFHTRVYRDEFGAPSTYRDWVPEPIVRQMIFEITKSRRVAEGTMVTQFANHREFDSAKVTLDQNKLLIDINALFGEQVNLQADVQR